MRERAHGASSIGLLRSVYYMLKVSTALLILPLPREPRGGAPS
jgi:hypothetical protein